MNVSTANYFFAFLSLGAATLAVLIVVAVIVSRFRPDGAIAVVLWDLRPIALWIAFAIATTATLGSLYYSEVANFAPCALCWYQRYAMYPLSVILGVAALLDEVRVKYLAIPIAMVGGSVSIYHYQLELFPDQGSGVCSASVPCTFRWFEVFGFISLAFMALTGFAAIIALLSIARPRTTHTIGSDGVHDDSDVAPIDHTVA